MGFTVRLHYIYPGAGLWGRRMSEVKRLDSKIMVFERILSVSGTFVLPWHVLETAAPDEHTAACIGFADGHAEFFPYALRSQFGDIPGQGEW